MIQAKHFIGFEKIILNGFKVDEEFMIVLHRLAPGKEFKPHHHQVEEFVVILNGTARLIVGEEKKDITPGRVYNNFIVYGIPARVKHTLVPLSTVTYVVIRPKRMKK